MSGLAPDAKRLSVLPFELPAILVGEEYLFNRELKQSTHEIFRRFYIKRRLLTGYYESDWLEIPEAKIMSYGTVNQKIDAQKLNFFDQSGVTVKVDNTDGYFADQTYPGSVWNRYHSQYRTLCKVAAGYYDSYTNMEFPTETTLFYGILTDDPKTSSDNTSSIAFRSMLSIFDEVRADQLPISTLATYTSDRIIGAVRDYTDSSGVKFFQQYFSITSWNFITATASYPNLATTTAYQGMTVLKMLQQLSASETYVLYIGPDGSFNYKPRTAGLTSVYSFYGGARFLQNQAHTIISMDEYALKVTGKIANWVRVHYLPDDTSTSYREAKETWTWGDSSSSFYYGVQKMEVENQWVNTAGADAIANTLLTEFSYPKHELQFTSKFFPSLHLLDRITVSYQAGPDSGAIWGAFVWGKGMWTARGLQANEFIGKDFYVIGANNDCDKFKTQITAREI